MRASMKLFTILAAIILTGWIVFSRFLVKDFSGEERKELAIIRLSSNSDPSSLDPRQGSDLPTINVLKMLYEGLVSVDAEGRVIPAIAESIAISPDGQTYTFHLKESFWSDASPLTAKDFEETWKSLLDPSFPAPNAYQFFPIKGAKAYKEGKGLLEDVGIKALDNQTLSIQLEVPLSYFLKLVSTSFYFPVHSSSRLAKSDGSFAGLVSNGPFKLSHWHRNNEVEVIKNPLYWDVQELLIDKIVVMTLDENTAFQMFEAGELDWTGSPMSVIPQDAVFSLRQTNRLTIVPAAGTHWLRFNTEKTPFDHPKMRKAFSLALDRDTIIENITQGKQLPALRIVPPTLGSISSPLFKDKDQKSAEILLQEALEELKLSKDQLPSITLSYPSADREKKLAQAIQQQWKEAFGIDIQLVGMEGKAFYDKVQRADYQIATGSWYADFSDPINFLEIFKYKTNSSNRTRWENEEYINLLTLSNHESDPHKRALLLSKAEDLLLEEMPVAPLFFGSFNFVKNEKVVGVHLSELGLLDFKYAFIEIPESDDELD